uniref:Cytochrome P450 2C31-like n=1 Tax=Xenopus tropicalis TaxID=8364 RepID=A0A803JMV7_XENTR
MEILSILTLFFIFLLTLLFLSSLWRQQKRSHVLPPGPTPVPLLGTPNYLYRDGILRYYPEFHKKYGAMFTLWQMTDPVVVLCGYETVKDALINHTEQFSDRPLYPALDSYTKGFNFLSSNNHWRLFRRFILMTLRNVGLGKRSLEEKSLKEAELLVEAVSEMGAKSFNPTQLLSSAVTNAIGTILFGQRLDYKDQKLLDLISHIRKHSDNIFSAKQQICNMFPVLLKLPYLGQIIMKNSLCLVAYVREQLDFHKETLDLFAPPRDFIDHFLLKIKEEKGNKDSKFCDTSLIMFISSILAAGSDSTTATLKYCLAIIARFPHIQAKVQREIDDVTGSQRPPGMSDRARMPYTNAVIHELQRHLDLAPAGFYRSLTQDIAFRGYTLPKGTRILPYLSSVLFDPSQWETPDEFNPGHFLDEKGQFRAKPAFMVFSAGKRECLGVSLARMEIFLFFSALLQKFTFCPTTGQRLSPRPPIPTKFHFILTSQIKAVLRSSKAA